MKNINAEECGGPVLVVLWFSQFFRNVIYFIIRQILKMNLGFEIECL
jgi:hypothetical protein